MKRFIIIRLLLFIPTLLVISIAAFLISRAAPGDPVERLLVSAESTTGDGIASGMQREVVLREYRNKLGLDLPVFYFRFGTLADPDTLYRISDPAHRHVILRMARGSGNPQESMLWYTTLLKTLSLAKNASNKDLFKQGTFGESLNNLRSLLDGMLREVSDDRRAIRSDSIESLLTIIPGLTDIRKNWNEAREIEKSLIQNAAAWKAWIPSFHFYGFNNQYHRWLFGDGVSRLGFIRGDFGISYLDGQPIGERIGQRMKWSIALGVFSIFLAYFISIPVGIAAAYYKHSFFDKISSSIFLGLFALPSFFVGTLLLVLFANPDFYDWFPGSGVKDPSVFDPSWPLYKRIAHYLPFLVLPIITYTYSSFAFITRQIRASVAVELNQDYVRTARAKGLSERQIIVKHVFRNTLIPIITMLATVLPASFGGSVIIETIFSIPGMGLEMYDSIRNYDYPMIVALFTIIGFLTVTGYLISDIAYALADPRIRFTHQKV
jgi:peptide/nickel transport system permease protein